LVSVWRLIFELPEVIIETQKGFRSWLIRTITKLLNWLKDKTGSIRDTLVDVLTGLLEWIGDVLIGSISK